MALLQTYEKQYKGTPDECNNSIFLTSKNSYVTKTISRNVTLKIARALRIILSFLSRTKYRPQIKEALKADAQKKIQVLLGIKFQDILILNKNNQILQEFYKQTAFQLIQAQGLINGVEVYSKQKAVKFEPLLVNCLYRRAKNKDIILLNDYKKFVLTDVCDKFNLKEIKEL